MAELTTPTHQAVGDVAQQGAILALALRLDGVQVVHGVRRDAVRLRLRADQVQRPIVCEKIVTNPRNEKASVAGLPQPVCCEFFLRNNMSAGHVTQICQNFPPCVLHTPRVHRMFRDRVTIMGKNKKIVPVNQKGNVLFPQQDSTRSRDENSACANRVESVRHRVSFLPFTRR